MKRMAYFQDNCATRMDANATLLMEEKAKPESAKKSPEL